MRSTIRAGLVVASLALAGGADAQIPQTFTNLDVLPDDIPRSELIGIMRGFSGALDVRCNFCHVGENPDDLTGYDFASDEKETKRVAREMMRMRGEINGRWLAGLGRSGTLEVGCATCHRGLSRPVPLRDEIATALDEGGPEAAIARYEDLREQYYGRAAYDFGAGRLNELTETLAAAERWDDALAIVQLNIEHHPEEMYPLFLRSQVQLGLDDREGAIASLERALELDPSSEFLRARLERLRTPPRG